MESIRQKQTAEQIKRHFSSVLQQEGNYIYGDAFVTVTNVKVTPDMSQAKIYVSIYNTEEKQKVLIELQEHASHLNKALAQRVKRHLRRCPQIELYDDNTLDEMYNLNQIFDRLHDENQMGDSEE